MNGDTNRASHSEDPKSSGDTPERRVRLPMASDPWVSSIDPRDGKRRIPVVADVKGRFTTARKVVMGLLLTFWLLVPVLRLAGRPLVFLDLANGHFFLFGRSFGVQDIHLLFFVVTGGVFALFVATALVGRVWCGWACPQTVFLEGVFRPIERLVEGSRDAVLKRERHGWTADRVIRLVVKHFLFAVVSVAISHGLMALFVSWPGLLSMVGGPTAAHPVAFGWTAAMSVLLYGNFAFFREQFCVVMCPYGRLQALLVDQDSLVIGYDEKRGEPRGKASDPTAGACVDCKRCVVVCPTGIDIRNGLQLDCIGCSACIDACDEVMDKLERPRGLVRYDSQNGLAGRPKRIWRGRLAVYGVMGLIGLGVATLAFSRRVEVAAHLLRPQGTPFVMEGDTIRNSFMLKLESHRDAPMELVVAGEGESLSFDLAKDTIPLGAMGHSEITVVVTAPRGTTSRDFSLAVSERGSDAPLATAKARFLSPVIAAPGGGK